jgi:hypothetical protein
VEGEEIRVLDRGSLDGREPAVVSDAEEHQVLMTAAARQGCEQTGMRNRYRAGGSLVCPVNGRHSEPARPSNHTGPEELHVLVSQDIKVAEGWRGVAQLRQLG